MTGNSGRLTAAGGWYAPRSALDALGITITDQEPPISTYEDVLDHNLGSIYWSRNNNPVDEHLTKIGEVELAEPNYSFDLLAFWVRKRDGQLLYATDSGCSCPMPFEDTKVRDLRETTLDTVTDVARREAHDPSGYGAVPQADVVQKVRDLIPDMREAGAR